MSAQGMELGGTGAPVRHIEKSGWPLTKADRHWNQRQLFVVAADCGEKYAFAAKPPQQRLVEKKAESDSLGVASDPIQAIFAHHAVPEHVVEVRHQHLSGFSRRRRGGVDNRLCDQAQLGACDRASVREIARQ